jgi:hypothetical protein
MPLNLYPTLTFECGHREESWLTAKAALKRDCPTCEGLGQHKVTPDKQEKTNGPE